MFGEVDGRSPWQTSRASSPLCIGISGVSWVYVRLHLDKTFFLCSIVFFPIGHEFLKILMEYFAKVMENFSKLVEYFPKLVEYF